MKMRDLIDIVTLNEGVDFYTSEKSVEDWDGKPTTVYGFPKGKARQEWVECEYCEGTGHDYRYDHDPEGLNPPTKVIHPDNGRCEPCSPPWGDGKGRVKKWVYDFPKMRVTHMHIRLLTDILGQEFDYSGSVEHDDLPDLKRRLIGILNRDASGFTIPATDEQGAARIDRSGDVPKITRGPRMIGPGVDEETVKAGVQRLLEIVDWAQKHGCGVSWA